MSKKKEKRYIFSLFGVNINKVDQKYNIMSSVDDEIIPVNTTKIDDLDISKKTPEILSFLDESKQLRKCAISMIDFQSDKKLDDMKTRYKCFWDRNYIPDNVRPIGCPIKYIPSKATKTYISEISKEKYSIRENVTKNKAIELEMKNDSRIKIDEENYYQTDGVFCSFNCCMAYIHSPENKNNPIYRYSEALLLKMYNSLNVDSAVEILPAPHWRTLVEFGGYLTIDQFRQSFNRVSYFDHGIICVSIGRLFEDKIKF